MLRWFSKPLSVRQMRLLCASLLAGFALCGALQGLCWGRTQLDAGAALCADTLRLHIRAASDAVADQSAKLRVRDAVLAVMQQCPAHSAPEARAWAAGQLFAVPAGGAAGIGRAGHPCPGAGVSREYVLSPPGATPLVSCPPGGTMRCALILAAAAGATGGVCCTRGCAALRRAATPCLRRTTLSAGSTFYGSGWWTGHTG